MGKRRAETAPRKPKSARRRAGLVPSIIFSAQLAGAAVIPAVAVGCGSSSTSSKSKDMAQFSVADTGFSVAAPFDLGGPSPDAPSRDRGITPDTHFSVDLAFAVLVAPDMLFSVADVGFSVAQPFDMIAPVDVGPDAGPADAGPADAGPVDAGPDLQFTVAGPFDMGA